MSYPHGQKLGFFPLSEGPSVMTDPELLGKTAVFPVSRITARSSKQSPIQKHPLAIILEVILYRIRANRQRLSRIPKTMYRNSPIFATKSGKSSPLLGWQGVCYRRRVSYYTGREGYLSSQPVAGPRSGLSDTPSSRTMSDPLIRTSGKTGFFPQTGTLYPRAAGSSTRIRSR